jgi:holo-[acyl-carrier protein] synthase
MMPSIRGLGTDIIEVERIAANLEKYGEKFLDKILTHREKEHCSKFKDPTLHVAGRFAAKEAVSKALGTGFGEHLEFHDIEIFNDPNGKPEVTLSKRARDHFGSPTILLSISHCKTHATATAII